MIVKHTKPIDPSKPGQGTKIILGKEYVVHTIYLSFTRSSHIGIVKDQDFSPIFRDIDFFEVSDPRIPDDWCFFPDGNGCYDLKPQEFSGNFWETYFDSTPAEEERARQIFTNVLLKIKRFHDRWDL